MSWATHYIEQLQQGETVSFRPRGTSMTPLVKDGELVTVEPVNRTLKKGDIVLCKVRGNHYLHLIKATAGGQVLIGNNHGRVNGWTPLAQVFGVLVT